VADLAADGRSTGVEVDGGPGAVEVERRAVARDLAADLAAPVTSTVERSRLDLAGLARTLDLPATGAASRALARLVKRSAETAGADQSPGRTVSVEVERDRLRDGSTVGRPLARGEVDVVEVERRPVALDRLRSPVVSPGVLPSDLARDAVEVESVEVDRMLDRIARATVRGVEVGAAGRRGRAFARSLDVSLTTGEVEPWSLRERGDALARLVSRTIGGRSAALVEQSLPPVPAPLDVWSVRLDGRATALRASVRATVRANVRPAPLSSRSSSGRGRRAPGSGRAPVARPGAGPPGPAGSGRGASRSSGRPLP
jgi:hypothetical protein